MSSTINASTASGGGVITTADASGILQLQTASTTALTIDASQNVGIGTSSPSAKLELAGTTAGSTQKITATTGAVYTTYGNTGGNFFIGKENSVSTAFGASAYATVLYEQQANPIIFYTTSVERMRIDSSGNLLVGTTTNNSRTPRLALNGNSVTWSVGPSASNSAFVVYNASEVGVYMGSGGSAWSSSSDERLKTDLTPIENGLDKVNSLRSVTGRFKTDEVGVSRSFLIAQDVQAVLPEAVSVQDDDLGTLGVAYTEVIPLLVASIKELKAIIDTQNARIEALEAKI